YCQCLAYPVYASAACYRRKRINARNTWCKGYAIGNAAAPTVSACSANGSRQSYGSPLANGSAAAIIKYHVSIINNTLPAAKRSKVKSECVVSAVIVISYA